MVRIYLFFFFCIITVLVKSQTGYEIVIGNDECNEAFEDIVINNEGIVFGILNGFCPNDTNDVLIQSKVYRIDPQGDSLVFDYKKTDTIFQFHNIIINTDGNIILAGEGFTSQKDISDFKAKLFPKYKEYIRKIQENGIEVIGMFIIGFDRDNWQTFVELDKFIEETKMFNFIVIYIF
jgi:hypothetical protein